jgi:micrococcal nuclease
MEPSLYYYKAIVKSVYDGDTCTVDIDLGLHIWISGEKIRLNRINAPEIKGQRKSAGLNSRDFLRNLILDKTVFIQTIKDRKEKYGRYLAEMWIKDDKGNLINVNDLMVQNKFAKFQKY